MDWSEMLPEILVKIAHKHMVFYEDYPSFAAVCKSWHSAALAAAAKVPKSNGPPSPFPSLLLAQKTEDEEEFRELFLLSNESTRKIRLPEAYGKLCLSSRGWLATVGDDHAVKLVNPLSRETINLPNMDTFPVPLDEIDWERGIWKLLVPSLEIVVVVWGSSEELGFCRPGDYNWTPVVNGWCGRIYDITYYNNRVYTINGNRHIQTCDIYGDDPTVMVMVSTLPDSLYNMWGIYSAPGFCHMLKEYILGLDDDDGRRRLLVIIREATCDHDDDDDDRHYRDDDAIDNDDLFIVDEDDQLSETTCMTESFKVFDYDLETKTWSKVKDLGRKTLFVGYNSSFWIEDTTGVIKGNCIYYTDDTGEGGRDTGIYHMSDGTIEPHYGGESLSDLTPPIWLQSI